MTLVTYLRKGFPIPVVALYCTMLSANWLISFYRFQQKAFDRELIVARLFYMCVLATGIGVLATPGRVL